MRQTTSRFWRWCVRRSRTDPATYLKSAAARASTSHFSDAPSHVFWPSDPIDAHRQSIAAWCAHFQTTNVMPPIYLDAVADDWGLGKPNHPPARDLSGIICVNVFHIAPWSVAQGVLRGAGKHLTDDGVLLVYGPFSVDGEHIAESNARFDGSLRAENPEWGVRDTREIATEAETHGLVLTKTVEMPVNTFVLVLNRR